MTLLSRNDEELILDYCLGLARTEQTIPVTTLPAHNEQAADLHARIRAALEPLRNLHPEPCPAELVERTVRLLCVAAQGVRATTRVRISESRFNRRKDRCEYSSEFDTYDAGETAMAELSPESTE